MTSSRLPRRAGPHNARLKIVTAVGELVLALHHLNVAPGESVDQDLVEFHLNGAARRIREAIAIGRALTKAGRNSAPAERIGDHDDQ